MPFLKLCTRSCSVLNNLAMNRLKNKNFWTPPLFFWLHSCVKKPRSSTLFPSLKILFSSLSILRTNSIKLLNHLIFFSRLSFTFLKAQQLNGIISSIKIRIFISSQLQHTIIKYSQRNIHKFFMARIKESRMKDKQK